MEDWKLELEAGVGKDMIVLGFASNLAQNRDE